MSSDFDAFLENTTREIALHEETLTSAREDEKEQRVLFLRRYRDTAHNVIRPVLDRVASRRTRSFGVEINETPECLELRLVIGESNERQVRRTARFCGAYLSKRVSVSFVTEHGESSGDTQSFEVDEVTEDLIEAQVRRLIELKRQY